MAVEPVVPWSRASITARDAGIVPAPATEQEERLPDVEAHITGTVWKITCEVGDEIEEGDRSRSSSR